ncbi:universal stress protein [Microbacterium sp. SS28]|uniref:universal stress protein n=1 Tax=Microbacterium sp. SS28 TaxID=2919948 RepID=UPI001FAB3070|nr:universal stress protein [Microbacterium sp. SS28]
MERIVLGYDGSPAAVAALKWTADRRSRSRAKVDVVNVISPMTRNRSLGIEQLADAEAYLRERAPGMPVELHRLEGAMPDTLGDFAHGVDLIVVGIDPAHLMRAAFPGLVPLELAMESSVPVCLVPAGWVEADDPVTVGIANDASSDSAVAFAAQEARLMSTGLRLVHAWLMPTPTPYGSTALALSPDHELEHHRAVLDEAMVNLMEAHPSLQIHGDLVRDSRAAALLKLSRTSSMLVIGTHHHGPLTGALLGSVAQEVLWRANCPVCVVPYDLRER